MQFQESMQWERKFRVLRELNFRVYLRNRSFLFEPSVSVADAVPLAANSLLGLHLTTRHVTFFPGT